MIRHSWQSHILLTPLKIVFNKKKTKVKMYCQPSKKFIRAAMLMVIET